MNRGPSRRKRGYTLLELTLALSLGMIVASISLLLFNQQIAFVKIYKAQDFLTREAPLVNNYINRVIGSAEGYRLYSTISSLRNGEAPVLADAKTLVMRYRLPDGSLRSSVISFDDPGSGAGQGLYYRLVPATGVVGNPDWAITKAPTDVTFSIEQGILRMRLTGPNSEELIYSGTEQ